jgi:hypothetical protein
LTDALKLLTQAYDDTIEALGTPLSLKDEETEAHSQRVTAYTISLAKSIPFLSTIWLFSLAPLFFTTSARWPSPIRFSNAQRLEKIRSGAGPQFEPKIVEAFLAIPWSHWIDLRESLGSPFRLTHSRKYGFCPVVPSKSPGTKIKSAIVTMAVSSHSTKRNGRRVLSTPVL